MDENLYTAARMQNLVDGAYHFLLMPRVALHQPKSDCISSLMVQPDHVIHDGMGLADASKSVYFNDSSLIDAVDPSASHFHCGAVAARANLISFPHAYFQNYRVNQLRHQFIIRMNHKRVCTGRIYGRSAELDSGKSAKNLLFEIWGIFPMR